MRKRYEGKEGKRRLVEVFSQQELVQHNNNIACKLADLAKIDEYQKGKQLYVQGEQGKNCLFFVLNGSFDLSSKKRHITTLEPGQAAGEFPIVDPSLAYTVSVVARRQSVLASVSEEQFLSIAKDYPEIWKNMAKMLITRLRNANKLIDNGKHTTRKKLKPGEITIGQLVTSLTTVQLYKTIAAIMGTLIAVATLAYRIGAL